ncbi:hypothetical protein C8Q80DRAFT_1274786 [Daedaleopsis nitida]|nr:hypothetical protein C8Q80DRAFT_1274786 [Daedaleopsis nitida]
MKIKEKGLTGKADLRRQSMAGTGRKGYCVRRDGDRHKPDVFLQFLGSNILVHEKDSGSIKPEDMLMTTALKERFARSPSGSSIKPHVQHLTSLTLNLGPHTTTPSASVGVSVDYAPFFTVNVTEGSNAIPLSSNSSRLSNTSEPKTRGMTVVRVNVEEWRNHCINLETIDLNDGTWLLLKASKLAFQFRVTHTGSLTPRTLAPNAPRSAQMPASARYAHTHTPRRELQVLHRRVSRSQLSDSSFGNLVRVGWKKRIPSSARRSRRWWIFPTPRWKSRWHGAPIPVQLDWETWAVLALYSRAQVVPTHSAA